MPTGIDTTRCGMSTSTSTLQAIRTLTMPMSISAGRQRAFSQMIRFGTPIPTSTNQLPMNTLMSVMGITAIGTDRTAWSVLSLGNQTLMDR